MKTNQINPNPATKNGGSFLPEDYEAPNGNNNYMKLQAGENRFRILSKPIIGWLDWKDKKPYRYPMDSKPPKPFDPAKPIKHFWAFVVYNHAGQAIQILEITQSTIQAAIAALYKDEDWGSPFDYDIKITKAGEGMETKYTTNPTPKKPVAEAIQEAFMAKGLINLEALFQNEDPFANVEHVEVEKDDLPF